MNELFTFHKLNTTGIENAKKISMAFDILLNRLNEICPQTREFSIAKTKLEESCFFAKKAMACQIENQEFGGQSESTPSDQTPKEPEDTNT